MATEADGFSWSAGHEPKHSVKFAALAPTWGVTSDPGPLSRFLDSETAVTPPGNLDTAASSFRSCEGWQSGGLQGHIGDVAIMSGSRDVTWGGGGEVGQAGRGRGVRGKDCHS